MDQVEAFFTETSYYCMNCFHIDRQSILEAMGQR
jgi:hypothetical protein